MLTTISTLATLPALSGLSATADEGRWDGDGPPAYWPIFPLLWLLVIAAVVATFVIVGRRRAASAPRRSGEARLAERYAAGEIDEEEYRTRRDVLREIE